jgi:hypothetical protein
MIISTKTFNANWLDNDHLHLVVAQPRPYGLDVMTSQASRTEVLTTLHDLFLDSRKLGELVTGGRPAVVLFPELALALSDWQQVDDAIRSYPSPVILISGFGVMTGAQLSSWLDETAPNTKREAAWTAQTAPATERIYNGGWCWIHNPGHFTSCVAFQKLTSEQKDEIQIQSLDTGRDLLRVELNDLIIYPVICSDFFAVVAGERLVANKIKDQLAGNNLDTRKVLVAGLLAQSKGHAEWRTAITDMTRTINLERVNVCLSNWAYDILQKEENEDRWRDYSGVYLATERRATLTETSVVRRFQTDALDASVSRVTEACILGGPLRWTFSAAARHIWSVSHGYLIGTNGQLTTPCCNDPAAYEYVRIIRRLSEPVNIPSTAKTPGMIAGLKNLKNHLVSANTPKPDDILQLLLFGRRVLHSPITADKLPSFLPELDQGSKALGILSLANSVSWQSTTTSAGQLFHANDNVELLVWCSAELGPSIWRAVEALRREIGVISPLIVFAKATGNVPAPVISSRRTDITSSPPPHARSAAEPKIKRRVLRVDLDELSAHLQETDEESCLLQINSALAVRMSEVKSL